jgi:hypothetical protein
VTGPELVEVAPSPKFQRYVKFAEVQQVFVTVTTCPQFELVIVNVGFGPITAVPPLQAPPHVSVKPLLLVVKLSTSSA